MCTMVVYTGIFLNSSGALKEYCNRYGRHFVHEAMPWNSVGNGN